MSQLADDLRAAKALIDTPEKYRGEEEYEGSIIGSLAAATKGGDPYIAAKAALVREMPATFPRGKTPFDTITVYGLSPSTTHADIMALFDRAIAAAEAEA